MDRPTTGRRSSSRTTYVPGIDGMRAVAVGAVIFFHLMPDALPGGFLGVDTFFVVSGYLITSLLLAEHAADNTVNLRAFWGRRIRRLLPALLVMLCVVCAAAAVWWPATDLNRVRDDALAGLGYVANWRFIDTGVSYFSVAAGQAPLRHLWSLAIEEQFYIAWPIVVALCLRRSVRMLVVVSAVGAAASVVLLIGIGPGDRSYFGTDTRAHALLIGALLAIALRHRSDAPAWLGRAGVVALAACVAAWWFVKDLSPDLMQWGYPLYALLTAVVIAAVVLRSGGSVARFCSMRPFVTIGKLSYGLYLWHWPAIVFLTEQRTGLAGFELGALRLAVTILATVVTYRFVERPVRFGTFVRGRGRCVTAFGVVTGLTLAVVFTTTAGAAAVPDYLRTPDQAGSPAAVILVNEPVTSPPTSTSTSTTRSPAAATATATTATQTATAGTTSTPAARRPTHVLLVGDSVAYTFADELGTSLANQGIKFVSAAVVGCGAAIGVGPEFGIISDDDGKAYPWASDCPGRVTSMQTQGMEAARPDLVLFDSSWETADVVLNGAWLESGSPEADENVLDALRAAIARLSVRGAVVAFLTVPPSVEAPMTLPPIEMTRRLHYNTLLAQIVDENPRNTILIDFATIVCDGDIAACPVVVDGITLRPLDGTHFEAEGAAWAATKITEQVTAIDLDALS